MRDLVWLIITIGGGFMMFGIYRSKIAVLEERVKALVSLEIFQGFVSTTTEKLAGLKAEIKELQTAQTQSARDQGRRLESMAREIERTAGAVNLQAALQGLRGVPRSALTPPLGFEHRLPPGPGAQDESGETGQDETGQRRR